jgi:hypothetical protein
MPNTLIPIQTTTLSSTSASVTFSNIPQNYTDLVIKASMRSDRTSPNSAYVSLKFSDAATAIANVGVRRLYGSGSAVAGGYEANNWCAIIPGAGQTASTFASANIYIPSYTSGNFKEFIVDSVEENNATTAYAVMCAGLWSSTSPVTTLTLFINADNSANFVSGSTFTLYGVSNGVKATGGTVTVAGGYAYHTFTSTSSFLPNQKIKNAEVLCVAGGGGGGGENSSNAGAGGGGAGGLLYSTAQTFNAGSSYTALVGSGGSGATAGENNGNSGSNSVFSNLTSLGGGHGTKRNVNGANGGSGGGGGLGSSAGGTGTIGQGNNGGAGTGTSSGGGGGGAGAAGSNAPANQTGGAGGAGSNSLSTWHSVTGTGVLSGGVYYIAGGGGGGGVTPGTGGLGGAGNGGSNSAGAAATANTGSGGGGAYDQSSAGRAGGNGGSGLIIIRYPLS